VYVYTLSLKINSAMLDGSWFSTSFAASVTVVLTAVGIYLVLVLFTRLAGLRTFSKMSTVDFAVTVAIGSVLASTTLTKDPPLAQSVVALAALFMMQYGASLLRMNSDAMTDVLDNRPVLVMAGPEILHENLKNVRMTENDLYAKLRQANVTRRDQIRAVVMETTGDVSVLHADPDGQPLEDELLYGVENADRLRREAG
jgi:uncharacterized membrane protein YcaP (DUF421 family)